VYGVLPSRTSGQCGPKIADKGNGRRKAKAERCPFFLPPATKNLAMGGFMMSLPIRYESEVKTVPFGGGTIRMENLTPILPPKERAKRRREVETCLFDVFKKYEDKNRRIKKL
jgi:hypothetical protein